MSEVNISAVNIYIIFDTSFIQYLVEPFLIVNIVYNAVILQLSNGN